MTTSKRVLELEGEVQAVTRKRNQAETTAKVQRARLQLLEEIIKDVWRWTNNGHPHLEFLTPILERADTEYKLLHELDILEQKQRIGR